MDCPRCGLPSADGLIICSNCGELLPVPKDPPLAYGGLGMRSLAWSIDSLIGVFLLLLTGLFVVRPLFMVYFFPEGGPSFAPGAQVGFDLFSIWSSTETSARIFLLALGFLCGFLPSAIYFTAFEASGWQATLGKRMAGLQVADLNGLRISPWRAFLRFTGRWVSLAFWPLALVSAATILSTKRHQALHDQLSGCVVARRR